MKPEQRTSNEGAHQGGHERADPPARPIGLAAVLIALLCVAAMVVMKAFHDREAPGASEMRSLLPLNAPQLAPAPRLQDQPRAEWLEFLARSSARAASYGWVDRERGLVRVPLEVALERVLAQGLPVRENPGREKPVQPKPSQEGQR